MALLNFPPDLSPMLRPIPGDNPVGEYLRYEGTYDTLNEARREDDPSLPQGVWKTALKKADWRQVARLCQKVLEERSKDLQVAAWLSEAWLRSYGFLGLATGARLMTGLVEQFWPTLYPELDGSDAAFRLSPIEWMDSKLLVQLKLLLITRPAAGIELPPCSYANWETALQREREANASDAAPPMSEQHDGEPPPSEQQRFLASANATPPAFFTALRNELRELRDALEGLCRALDEKLGEPYGLLRQLRSVTQEIAVLVDQISGASAPSQSHEDPGAQDEHTDSHAAAADGELDHADSAAEVGGRGRGAGPIRSRADAYQRLTEAADFLMRTEPHSPAPYLVKRAVAWGNLTLVELLAEIVASQQDLASIYTLLGVRRGGGGGGALGGGGPAE